MINYQLCMKLLGIVGWRPLLPGRMSAAPCGAPGPPLRKRSPLLPTPPPGGPVWLGTHTHSCMHPSHTKLEQRFKKN